MISRKILSDQIRDTILERILNGEYRQGDRIIESQIAREFEVSQSPIREALRDLVAMQFVELEPYKGARVRQLSADDVLKTYPVRAALEELAGELAAPNLKGNVGSLEKIFSRMDKAARSGNSQELTRLDARFHRTIVEAADNGVLARTWDSLMIESWTYVTVVKIIPADTDLNSVVAMHRPIIEALDAGDADVAGERMKNHIASFAALLQREFEEDTTTALSQIQRK